MTSPGRWIATIAVASLLGLAVTVVLLESAVETDSVETAEDVSAPSFLPLLQDAMPVLPDEALRSALSDICAGKSGQPVDGSWNSEETQAQLEWFNELKRNLSNSLSVSTSAEHLYLAALLDNGPASRVELIDRAASLNPNDPFVLWGAVHICTEELDETGCPLRDWENRLLEIDGQNSESWIRVAANRYQADDLDSALDALRHAAASAETRAYWTETIEMIERGFAAASDFSFPQRAAMAFGFAAAKQPNYGDYVKMCRQQSAESVDWAYECLAYGELVENQGKLDMGVSIAQTMQMLALEALGDVDGIDAVEQRKQTRRQELLDSVGKNDVVTEGLMLSNLAVFSSYLAAVRTHGESGARAYLAEETSRVLEERPELACTN